MTLVLGAGFAPALDGAIIHVPQDQPTIQAGINAAVDGDTVLVDDGTWSSDGNRDIDFYGKAITVRSLNGPDFCTIHCGGGSQNHRAFFIHSGEGLDSVVEGFTIIGGSYFGGMSSDKYGGAICVIDSGLTLVHCRLNGNQSRNGGGLHADNSTLVIRNSVFVNNDSEWYGGGIRLDDSAALIKDSVFAHNYCGTIYGGNGSALYSSDSFVSISNSLIRHNNADGNRWAMAVSGGEARINFCTFADNTTGIYTTALYVRGDVTLTNSVFYRNSDDIYVHEDGSLTATWSNLDPGDGTVWPGKGNINEDPLFVPGPWGAYYLSQTAAGQAADSPCVDAGDPQSATVRGATRTDEIPDRGVADMGYHFPAAMQPLLATGPGPDPGNPPTVRVFPPVDDAEHEFAFLAYGVPAYGVNVATGDPDGDGVDETLTGAGPGAVFGPHVRGFEVEGVQLPGLSFLAYGTNKYGVNVACGDVDGDGTDEIITGAGPGAVFGPHVRGWNYQGETGVMSLPGVNYFAYGTPKWGVNVTAGDIDGDGYDEIVTGAGPGAVYGPHVRGWNVDGGEATAIPAVSFFAYGTNKYGVNVTAGDVDGDGIDEIITGAGPGIEFGPHVRGWNYDGSAITSLPGFSFFAWDSAPLRFSVNVSAGADLDGDGRDELVAGRGPDPEANTEVKVFDYDGIAVSQRFMLKAFPGYRYGSTVAAGEF
jgi:hypothetical protein